MKQYLKKDISGYYYNSKSNQYVLKGVKCRTDKTRNLKAIEQAGLKAVPIKEVYAYINDCLDLVRLSNGYTEKIIKEDSIVLDNKVHRILNNGIVIKDLKWTAPDWKTRTFDKKYSIIQKTFGLQRETDLLWIKFTKSGQVAVVSGSADINWDYTLSSGILVKETGDELDDSFVLAFPLTQEMIRTKADPNSYCRKYSVSDLELIVGNYLISKGVPIVDYYSHMGYKYSS